MKEQVLSKYPKAYAKRKNGYWYIMNSIYELGMGFSEDAAWADACITWC